MEEDDLLLLEEAADCAGVLFFFGEDRRCCCCRSCWARFSSLRAALVDIGGDRELLPISSSAVDFDGPPPLRFFFER